MDENKVKVEIEKLTQKLPYRQYPASKKQMAELSALGIGHLMPERFLGQAVGRGVGHTDAKIVIAAAKDAGGYRIYGDEGFHEPPSALYQAIHGNHEDDNPDHEDHEDDEPKEVDRYVFGDECYIIYNDGGTYSVDADWADGPAAEFDHEPTEQEVRAIHDDYLKTISELDAIREIEERVTAREAAEQLARDAREEEIRLARDLGKLTRSHETKGEHTMTGNINLINLTPHSVDIHLCGDGDGGVITVPPSGAVARVAETRADAGAVTVDGADVPVSVASYGATEGLPDPAPGKIFIVSALVLAAVGATRRDVVAPGPAVRDAEGRIIGCQGLSGGPAWLKSPEDGNGDGGGKTVKDAKTLSWRSTNGRWQVECELLPGVIKLDPAGDIQAYRGRLVVHSRHAAVIEPGDSLALIGGDLEVYRGYQKIDPGISVDLQSNRSIRIVPVQSGDVVISYGYKRRSAAWYRVAADGRLVRLSEKEKAEFKTERRRYLVRAEFIDGSIPSMRNYPARVRGRAFWADLMDDNTRREAASPEEILEWMESVGPLADWLIE